MLRIQDDLIVGGVDEQNGVTTAKLQNAVRTSSKWNGLQMGKGRTTRLQSSLTEQTGMQASGAKQNRMQTCSVNGNEQCSMQNGIGPHTLGQTGTQPCTSTSGLHIRSYYTSREEEDCVRREAGAARMVSSYSLTHLTHTTRTHIHMHTHTLSLSLSLQLCLKKCLQKAREDLNKLRRLQCPYVVSAIGVHFSPPRYTGICRERLQCILVSPSLPLLPPLSPSLLTPQSPSLLSPSPPSLPLPPSLLSLSPSPLPLQCGCREFSYGISTQAAERRASRTGGDR